MNFYCGKPLIMSEYDTCNPCGIINSWDAKASKLFTSALLFMNHILYDIPPRFNSRMCSRNESHAFFVQCYLMAK